MFIDHLKQACSDKGTTVTALLRKLHISKGNIAFWNGGGMPSVARLTQIAEELGCSVDFLLGTGEKKAPATPEDDEREKKIGYLMNLVKSQPDEKLDAIIALLATNADKK